MSSHLWELFSAAASPGSRLHLPSAAGGPPGVPLPRLYEDAEHTARAVGRRIARDDRPARLGILMANGEPWLRGFLAAMRLGATAVPLPLPVAFSGPDAYARHIARLARQAGLDAVLVDASLGRHLCARVTDTVAPCPVVDVTDPVPGAGALPSRLDPDALAVVQYTSGSTSAPKGVALTHRNVAHGLETLGDSLGWRADDAWGVWVPLFHDMGLITALAGLARGSSVCLWRPADAVRRPMDWLASFAASPATAVSVPNFYYDLLCSSAAESGVPEGLDLSRWRIAANAAEPVQHRTMTGFLRTFGPHGLRPSALRPSYGMAEATLLVSTPQPSGPWRTVGVDRDGLAVGEPVVLRTDGTGRQVVGCGQAARSMGVRIVSPRGEVCPELVLGEVEISGPPVTGGYLDTPADQQPFRPDGWLRTGDLGFLHDGELFVTGRLKGVVTVRGRNFHAEDVEEIVRGTAGADRRRAAALAWDSGDREEMVVLLESSLPPLAAEELARAARNRVTTHLGLHAVRVVPVPQSTIPHTSSGKVRRLAARDFYADLVRQVPRVAEGVG
ncbi:AMP-binding protein [Streptomyces sp. NPDC005805]|uniref:AMP-binding protein n=1 Tax=Streptomyces sp. NPDC005805 TaxID=3157068 RepID=UPI0033D89441